MTLLEIVEKLREEGHEVSYRVRTDGGIIIQSIDGKKFSGATGNAVARQVVGAELSQARKVQLERIKPPKGKSPTSRTTPKVEVDLDKLLRKVQRYERKWDKEHTNQPSIGRTTKKHLNWTLRTYGREEAIRRLEQALRRARGLAYDENINQLLFYITSLLNLDIAQDVKDKLVELHDYIQNNRDTFRDDKIYPIYHTLYSLNWPMSNEEKLQAVETALRVAKH